MSAGNDAIVDGDQTASEGGNEPIDSTPIRGEDTGGQMLPTPAMQGKEFFFGSPGADHEQWPEVLRIECLRVERAVEDGLRPHPPSVGRVGDERRGTTPAIDRIFDEPAMSIRRGIVDHLAFCGPGRERYEGGGEFRVPIRVHEHSPGSHARLAGIHGHRGPDAAGGDDRISIIQQDGGITSGEFERGGQQTPRRRLGDQRADRGRTGEDHMVEIRLLEQTATVRSLR